MVTARIVPQHLILGLVWSLPLLSQQKPAASVNPPVQEYPVVMQQSIIAGKTAVGTKVQAKLEVATLLAGTVLPRNAVLSGEIVESVAKTSTDPCRLAIRMDSVEWKGRSAAIKVYLTAWFYPATEETGQTLQYGPPESPGKTWNGQGAYPSRAPSYKPFPGGDKGSEKNPVPDTATTKLSDHRVVMKGIEMMRADDGTLMLFSKRGNIKLDKLTTYVFSASDSLRAK
jgi:hypothetical protein